MNQKLRVRLRGLTAAALLVVAALPSLGASSCSGGAGADTSGGSATTTTPNIGSIGGTSTGASGSSAGVSTNNNNQGVINAIQIITKADATGSFDPVSVPIAGGTIVRASRLYNLDGSLITVGNVPPWFVDARVFLTSTRTTSGLASNTGADTPCAYFDSFNGDNNPDSSGFYTIDGYNGGNTALGTTPDIDQCAGTSAAEQSQLSISLRLDRRFLNSSDKLQIIVKAKPIDQPNTTVTPSSCVTSGFFDPGACSNQLFTLTMRTAPNASAKPFYILFPSAKALDLLTESVLVPINIDQSISTISIDRVKGGAIFYGISVIRLQ